LKTRADDHPPFGAFEWVLVPQIIQDWQDPKSVLKLVNWGTPVTKETSNMISMISIKFIINHCQTIINYDQA
jgi:hypothetical protein